MKKISVILPVYNGEKYLARAIDSVLRQKNFDIDGIEVLVINDGSKDNSSAIVRTYQKEYSGIVCLIEQENMGVAKTRNKGMKLAKGTYVMFLDQDDYYCDDAFSKLYEIAEKTKADVVSSGYDRPTHEGKVKYTISLKDREYCQYMLMAAWSKIHRRTFILENKIEFFDNNYGEDIIFTIKEICCAQKWHVIPKYIAYHWYYNDQSVSNTLQVGLKKNDGHDMYIDALLALPTNKNRDFFEYFLLRELVYYLLRGGRNVTPDKFLKKANAIVGKIKERRPRILANRFWLFGPTGEKSIMRITIAIIVAMIKTNTLKFFAQIYCKSK